MSQRASSRRKAKGFFAESQELLLRPIAFFERLPEQGDSRTWLFAACLILFLVGYSAVQQIAPTLDEFSANPVQQQVIAGLMAASRLLIAWLVQALLLLALSILSRKQARFALNLHIAIWSSLPYAILAIIQIAYLWAGGPIGGTGLAPLISEILPYEQSSSPLGIILLQAAQHLTLFSFWNLALICIGAMVSLRAKAFILVIVILVWILLVLLVPTFITILSQPQTGF